MDSGNSSVLKIGVVGFSMPFFDHEAASALLATSVQTMVERFGNDHVEIVSGLTNTGVPRLAYLHANRQGFTTTGISARRALSVSSGVYAVDRQILEGEVFGEESHRFINYVDCLIRVGGGAQSHREVMMFRERCQHEGLQTSRHLIEHELKPSPRDDVAAQAASAE